MKVCTPASFLFFLISQIFHRGFKLPDYRETRFEIECKPQRFAVDLEIERFTLHRVRREGKKAPTTTTTKTKTKTRLYIREVHGYVTEQGKRERVFAENGLKKGNSRREERNGSVADLVVRVQSSRYSSRKIKILRERCSIAREKR